MATVIKEGKMKLAGCALGVVLTTALLGNEIHQRSAAPEHSLLLQGDTRALSAAVEQVGGEITHRLPIINALGVRLNASELESLEALPVSFRRYQDVKVHTATIEGSGVPYLDFPALIDADDLHSMGIDGRGVTVAILDSGFQRDEELQRDPEGNMRKLAEYQAMTDTFGKALDRFGHGSHVASIILNSEASLDGKFNSVAPRVSAVGVKAFGPQGTGSYGDVIRGLQWILDNRETYNIRVVNLSFSATPRSRYWDDPLNQAVMKLWQAGVVVVASAGNRGPDPMTVGVPGNLPYIITVGAMTDNYTPANPYDDRLASFSSAGPTAEGFVKPEVVAPGGHLTGHTRVRSTIAKQHPEFHSFDKYFTMSGTSQSAAVVSGIAALVLQEHPELTPDEVKCRIMASARPAVDEQGELAYSIFQQGTGLVNAYRAVFNDVTACANNGLDIEADIAGSAHFMGLANQAEDGSYYIEGMEAFMWNDGFFWSDGFLFNDAFFWADGFLWSDAFLFNDGFFHNDGFLFNDAFLWSDSLTEPASVNSWVEQE